MKKLMVIAAFACAVAANAATVQWSTGEVYAPNGDAGGYISSFISGEGYTSTLYCFTDAGMTQAWTLLNGTGIDSTSNNPDGDGWIWSDGVDATTVDQTIYAYMEIVNSKGQTLTSNAFSFEVTAMDGATIYNGANAGDTLTPIGDYTFDETYGAWSTSGWSSVPEPTSGLLLLIGVAGLALRRRRA